MATAANLARFTVAQLKAYAAASRINLPPGGKSGKPGVGMTEAQLRQFITAAINPKRPQALDKIDSENDGEILKSMFKNTTKHANATGATEWEQDVKDASDQLVDSASNETTNAAAMMASFMTPPDRVAFKEAWKKQAAQQAANGSFLEFQGMRFVTGNAEVYDAKRDNTDDGRNVFRHIMQPAIATKPRLYLKSKFTLTLVNSDTGRICPGGPTWREIMEHAKGKTDCEPDLIVRTHDAILIFELKMGYGKPETRTQPKEYHQLLRARHLLEKFMTDPEYLTMAVKPTIKLYFVGWSAPTAASVVFAAPTWEESLPVARRVKPINGPGMKTNGCPINDEIVTKIIGILNIQRAIAYYNALKKYFEPWGEGRPAFNTWINTSLSNIARGAVAHRNAITSVPPGVTTRLQKKKQAANAAATANKLRSMAAGVVNLATSAAASLRTGAARLLPMYPGPSGKQYERTSPENFRFCAEAFGHGTRSPQRLAACLAASPSVQQQIFNALTLRRQGINDAVIRTVLANRESFDKAYANFKRDHVSARPELAAQLANVLGKQPVLAGRENNFAQKLELKRMANRRAAGRAAAAGV